MRLDPAPVIPSAKPNHVRIGVLEMTYRYRVLRIAEEGSIPTDAARSRIIQLRTGPFSTRG
jgi:hypothetical protein